MPIISLEARQRLERERPAIVAPCQRRIASVVSNKLLDSLTTFDALMR